MTGSQPAARVAELGRVAEGHVGRAVALVRRRAGDVRDDRGVATVFTCICAMALIAVTVMVLQLGAATVARHRAEQAADLGALAGAAVVLRGEHAACRQASSVTKANHATVTDCALERLDVLLTVTVEVRFGLLHTHATGRARAGPCGATC